MKTKIIAAVLAAVLLLHVGGEFTRAKATGAAVAGITAIGILAFNLIGVMSGQYDDTAEGISCFIENGVDGWQKAFVGTENTPSWFASGWQQIYDTCSSWFDSGEITINDDGKVRMKYSQYLELCGLIGEAYATTDVQLVTDIPYFFFKAEPNISYHIDPSISINSTYELSYGMSYSPVFYTDDKIYFSDTVLFIKVEPMSGYCSINAQIESDNFDVGYVMSSESMYSGSYYTELETFFTDADMSVLFNCNEICCSFINSLIYGPASKSKNINCWYSYDGFTFESLSSVPDFSNTSFAILNSRGKYFDFIKSITSFKSTIVSADIDDLSDPLATVLTKTTDPTLEIDTDPAIVSPDDAVMVTDIPGEGDLTLSQLKEKTRTDIDIPSLIADKFPFCIPFDFIRIISVLCSDPVAPIFRIPISTNPENLEAFEGNQTIGDIPEDFKPMFEIDEEIVIDLSCIPLVQPICYTIFILGFVILLIYITPKMINH